MASPTDRRARFQLAHFGAAIGDPSRAAMLVALMGGVSLPASELARVAGVSASTATSHLHGLLEAGLVRVREQGRHRYFTLSGAEVAAALEQLASLGQVRSRRRAPATDDALAFARTCYAHLAGSVAIAFWTRAREAGWVSWDDANVCLLAKGASLLVKHGLFSDPPRALVGTSCLDWSERVPHVAGRLGVAVCDALLARGWLKRRAEGRALRLTVAGEDGLRALGVRWDRARR